MRAAVVTAFDTPPTCQNHSTPTPRAPHEVLIDVLAAGLHPRVRSQADGSHYTSTDELPLIPGIDGVGRAPDGTLRYFVLPDTTIGAMAEHTIVDLRRSITLPEDCDPVAVAAAMNPAMSSWVALRRRIECVAGHSVLVLGAPGNAGRLAIQVAKHTGAGQVIAAGRGAERLPALLDLGADETVSLDGPPGETAERLGQAASEVDVVLDYLWGAPAAEAMAAIVRARRDESRPLAWLQIGSVAGPAAPVPSAALRAARLQILGSGQGSVATKDILAELPELAHEISRGTFAVNARPVPLADVESAWRDTEAKDRVVIVP